MRINLFLFFLIFNSVGVFASRLDIVYVASESLNKSIPNIVIIPDNYSTQKESFPVLYLLHGACDDYTIWVTKVPGLKDYADKHNIIIVCPVGGHTSRYFNSPIDKQMNYESYISKELIAAIDNKYQTKKSKNARAITGASMGEYGAFYLYFKHQDIYGAAGSMSGGMDIRPFPNNWDLPKRLENYFEH